MHRTTGGSILIAILILGCTPADDAASDAAGAADTSEIDGTATNDFAIDDDVFSTPESVLWDEQADMYYVSNINGAPNEKDGNGYITRVRPDGTVDDPKWIDGEADGVTLHAPKGMAVIGDTLWVADIDSVRAFHRTTGAPLGARGVPDASFLNDLARGDDGALYVTDTGVDGDFQSTGTEAVLRMEPTGAVPIVVGAHLMSPNGIIAADGALVMVPFGSAEVLRVPLDGSPIDTIATLPAGQLDGVIRTNDGELIVSSWESNSLYRIDGDGSVSVLADNLEAPADLGYDARRNRVLVPLFNANRVEVRTIR